MDKKVQESKYWRALKPAMHHSIWDIACGGSNSEGLGGCVVIQDSCLYATSDDADIWMYDLNTTMFDFCKTHCLSGGHSHTVMPLSVWICFSVLIDF